MTLHVVERKESTDSVLERVIEYRPGWLKMDYQYRPEDLRQLNVVEYVTNYGIPVSKSRTALTNYRYYYDMVRFSELCADPSIDQQVAAEMRNMPKGADVATWFLENYQLKACAFCAKSEDKLWLCAGCHSFAYCCSEHQVTDWKAKHKFVCLKRKASAVTAAAATSTAATTAM